jgi:UDP-3-O-[3-hydroxymyristoyl] glucosamine N-acyltransferase LpxD
MHHLAPILEGLSIPFERLASGGDDSFGRAVPAGDLQPWALCFVQRGSDELLAKLVAAAGGVALVEAQWAAAHRDRLLPAQAALFAVPNARLAMARVLQSLDLEEHLRFQGVHPTAIVAPGADLHPSVVVGPYTILGRCVVAAQVTIGPFCVVEDNVHIGRRVTIREHCTIGGYGFAYERGPDGLPQRLPHLGTVVIEDDVDVFPFVNVDRGTFGETRVRRGAKLDHYVHVGHNSDVGEDAIVTASSVLCGNARVGPRTWLGVGSIVKQGVKVGADALVGLGAVVLRDVPEGETVAGVPARSLRRDSE